jgi:4-amino-4-deoxy-L-arabinose transferase-like glycosyltransferase
MEKAATTKDTKNTKKEPKGRLQRRETLWFLLGVLCVLCGCSFLFFHRLADRDLWSSHEGRAAQDAQAILDDGRWGLPHLFDGRLELQKPPLYYWLVAALARLQGGRVDAWVVRLPAALAGLGCVLGLSFLGWYRGRPIAGLVGAAVLATMVHFTWLARTGRIDLPLTAAVGVALGGFYLGRRCRHQHDGRGGWWWLLLAYTAVIASVMLKGPIGVVLSAGVAGFYLLIEGDLPAPWQVRRWCRLAHGLGLCWGVPLVLGLAVPWFWWADRQTGGAFFRSFFLYHNYDRAFGGSGGLRAHPFWFYGPRLAVDLLPWGPPLAAALLFLRRDHWRKDAELRFGLVWLAVVVALLSCVRFKRADYLLPAYPGAALVLGCTAERWSRTSRHPGRLAAAFGLVLLGCLAGWGVFLGRVLPADESARDQQRFAAAIRQEVPEAEPVLFFRTESHALAFHVHRPIDTFVEWEKLDRFAARDRPAYVVMPPDSAAEWPEHLKSGRLEPLLSNQDGVCGRHEHPLVLLRSRPLNKG